VTRPNLFVGVLAAACVGTLLWCAWLILAADLPRGAHVASWVLWLVATAAVVTLVAYLREFLSHRQAVGSDASWKPLPGLVLLWIGGLTALTSFAFILPERAPSGSPAQDKAGTSLTSATAPSPSLGGPSNTMRGAATPAGSTTTSAASRSADRTTTPSGGPTTAGLSAATPSRSSTSRTTAPSTSTSSTTSPLIDVHILPTQAHPTTPPGQ
jgi:hypothetical protein